MFATDSLDAESFSWNTALSMALCSQLSYHPADAVVRVARSKWLLDTCEFVEAGHTQSFIASTPSAIVVAFRGTESFADWVADLKLLSTARPYGRVHSGFYEAFTLVRGALSQRVERLRAGGRRLLLTGHSLGGALAAVAAADLWDEAPADAVYTFGQPRVGGRDFAGFVADRFGARYFRFVNDNDLVTRLPPHFQHCGTLIHFNEDGSLRGGLTESVGAATEPPALSEDQFREVQETARRAHAASHAVGPSAAEAEATASATLEGILPGASDHRLDRYIASIRRFVADATEAGVDRSLEMSQQLRATSAATEAVRGAYSGNYSNQGTPVLLRLRTPEWDPPEGLKVQSRVGLFVTAHAHDEHITKLRSDPEVLSVEASRDAGVQDCAVSMPFIGAPQVHFPPGGETGEFGDRAIVGVIDSGIDILHEGFLTRDGQTTRILGVWNQRDSSGPTPRDVDAAAFSQDYGAYYNQAEIARMTQHEAPVPGMLRDPDWDTLGNPMPGHGTHVASIAAGRPVGQFAGGVAHDAKLIVVIPNMVTSPGSPPSLGYSNSHIDAISFLRSAAAKEGLPMAVNVSLGMNAGAHDGLSSLEAAFDALTGNGRAPGFVIVKSAGNEGASGGHAEVQAVAGETEITWESADRFRPRDYIEVWYDEWQELEFVLVDPEGNESDPVSDAADSASSVLGGNFCTLALRFPHPDCGHHLLQITIVPDSKAIQPGQWTLRIIGSGVFGALPMVHAWVERDKSRSVRFATGDSNAMTISVPGTAQHVITVSASGAAVPIRVPAFSSKGLTRDGRPKPDLCAPGETVVAAASNAPDAQAVVEMHGTSMAAPHVAGAIALALSLREKSGRSQLNANQLKAALKRTCKGANGVHHPAHGFGALDVAAFVEHVRSMP